MQDEKIDIEAARRAIRKAMGRLATYNLRAYSVNVVDTAVRELEAEWPGQVTFLEAVEIVKAAVVEMGESGELEWYVEPHRDWTLQN